MQVMMPWPPEKPADDPDYKKDSDQIPNPVRVKRNEACIENYPQNNPSNNQGNHHPKNDPNPKSFVPFIFMSHGYI